MSAQCEKFVAQMDTQIPADLLSFVKKEGRQLQALVEEVYFRLV